MCKQEISTEHFLPEMAKYDRSCTSHRQSRVVLEIVLNFRMAVRCWDLPARGDTNTELVSRISALPRLISIDIGFSDQRRESLPKWPPFRQQTFENN